MWGLEPHQAHMAVYRTQFFAAVGLSSQLPTDSGTQVPSFLLAIPASLTAASLFGSSWSSHSMKAYIFKIQ